MYILESKLTNLANYCISSTIIICYFISYVKNTVPLWLPMISDCFVVPPASYISRIGLPFTSCILVLHNIILHEFINSSLAIIPSIASLCLCIVSAVNEKENIIIHNYAAYIFFVLYMFNMLYVSYFIRNKLAISLLYTLFVLYAPFGFLPQCEWAAVGCLIIFVNSTNNEIGHVKLCDIFNFRCIKRIKLKAVSSTNSIHFSLKEHYNT